MPSVSTFPLHFHPELGPTQNPKPEQQPHPPDSGVMEQSLLVMHGVEQLELISREIKTRKNTAIWK